MAQLADNHALLLYRVGPVLCCAPTLPVATLLSPPSLTHPPGSSASRPGIFRHDGQLVSLIELRHLFGVEEQDRTQPGRIIICHLDDQRIGFLVDEVIDVIATPAHGWRQLPASLGGGAFRRSLLLDEKIHLYCEFKKLHMLRSNSFLKPWIQQLDENRENAPAPAGSTIMEKKPVPAETEIESHTIPPPPAASSRTVSDCRSQQSAQQRKERTPHHAHSNKAGNSKYSALNSTYQTENKNRQPTTLPGPTHSATQPLQASATRAPPETLCPGTPHPVAETPKRDVGTQAPISVNRAGANLHIMAIVLISTGLITAVAYLWPTRNTNPAIRPATTDTPATKVFTATEPASPHPESRLSPIANKHANEIPNAKSEDETGGTVAAAPHNGPGKEHRYHATIEHQHHEVTIILSAPTDDTVIRKNPDSRVAQKQPQGSPLTLNPAPDAAPTNLPTSQHTHEVVHIVVRGDTLWHIARRYIHNPFRYPELARLNKIRNPNLIYPGDRVRIIRIYRQQPASVSAD